MFLWDIAHFNLYANNSEPFIWNFGMESLRWKRLETRPARCPRLGIDPTGKRV